MKINSQEMLFVNNKKLKNNPIEQPQTQTIKEPVQNPEETLKALNLVGKNNLTFQGINMLKNAKLAIPAALLGLAALTSCEKFEPPVPQQIILPSQSPDSIVIDIDVNQETNVEVNVDLALVESILSELKESNAQIYGVLVDLLNEYKSGNANSKEFYEKWYAWMEQDEAFKGFVMDKLENQMTPEEAKHFYNTIILLIQQGNVESAVGMELLLNEIRNGNGLLAEIRDAIKDAAEQAHNDHLELMNSIDSSKVVLDSISSDLKEIIKNQGLSLETQQKIEENTRKLNEKQDSTNAKLDRLIVDLADLKAIISSKDFEGCDQSGLLAYLQARDPKLFALLENLNIKADNIADLLAGLDKAECEHKDYTAWFNKVADLLTGILGKLDGIDFTLKENQDKLEIVIEKMDTICDCECGKDDPNEDILEDLDGIFG